MNQMKRLVAMLSLNAFAAASFAECSSAVSSADDAYRPIFKAGMYILPKN